MSLSEGAELGPYQITGQIGAGGMGEVYRARDTALGREVAIKVLSESFTADADRVARFEQEARTLAALSHPNIAQIFGVERSGEFTAIVMELIDGPTLADRIAEGPLPVDEALAIAVQIADALEAAHGRQVIHRDLKPANVKLTGDGLVKLLDFGIAKLPESARSAGGAATPTLMTPALTEAGVLLGTAAYMSPEQAKGRPIDQRADIWAFACVLYELLTGQPAFPGEDVTTTLARVLEREPDLGALPDAVPPAVRQAIALCLKKDARERIRHIGDVRLALAGAFDAGADGSRATHEDLVPRWWARPLPFAALLSLVAVAAGLAGRSFDGTVLPAFSVRSSIVLPPELPIFGYGHPPAVFSPDGETLAIVADNRIVLRRLDRNELVVVAGTDGAASVTFSPDGEWIAFHTAGLELLRVRIDGTNALRIAQLPVQAGAPWWGEDDRIYFGTTATGGLFRVPASGGEPEQLTTVDTAAGEVGHRYPQLLPGGRSVLFSIFMEGRNFPAMLSLENGSYEQLGLEGGGARFLQTGHLVFVADSTLVAAPFDSATRQLTGDPIPVLDGVAAEPGLGRGPKYSWSSDGTLVYSPAVGGGIAEAGSFLLTDRSGSVMTTIAAGPGEGIQGNPQFAPNENRFAAVIPGSAEGTQIWLYDIGTGNRIRLTRGAPVNTGPIWTSDGSAVVFNSVRNPPGLYRQSVGGSQAVDLLVPRGRGPQIPLARTGDGTGLVYSQLDPETRYDLWLKLADAEPAPLLATAAAEGLADVAFDGRRIAYQSDESGQFEIYVAEFPAMGSPVLVSREGGMNPRWAGNDELVYFDDGRIVSVAMAGPDGLRAGQPVVLFEGDFAAQFDVSADGERFLLFRASDAGPSAVNRLELVQNWFEELERLVPIN